MATINYIVNAIDNASRKLLGIATAASRLEDSLNKATAATAGLDASTAVLAGRVDNLGERISRFSAKMTVNTRNVQANTEALNHLTEATLLAAAATDRLQATQMSGADATTKGGTAARWAYGGWFGLWNLIRRPVTLFGGAFGAIPILGIIGGFHLLTEVVLEFIAVWLPASIAMGAWGLAASDAIRDVMIHMQNLHTVSDATAQTIAPMTGALEKMHEAVRPAVYQLFGDALTIMNDKTGLFQQLVKGTTPVLDQLGARITVATVDASKFGSKLVGSGPADIAKLGDSFASLIGIIGNFIKVLPGYAEILLSFGAGILHIAEQVSIWAQKLISIGLILHGFIVWVGLGASAIVWLGRALLGLAGVLGGVVAELVALGIEMAQVTAESGILAGAMVLIDAAGGPFLWIAAAVAALTVLTIWMIRSKDATQKWTSSLNDMVMQAPSVTAGLKQIASNTISVSNAMGAASVKQANTQKYLTEMNLHTGMSYKVLNPAYVDASNKVSELHAATTVLSDQQKLSDFRINSLAHTYGNAHTAMGLVTAAGITMKQWMTKNPEEWAIIRQQVAATAQGYEAMGQKSGTLAHDMEILDQQATDQYKAMTTLNSAWDTFIGNMTGTQTSFDTMQLGLLTLGKNFDTAQKVVGTTTHSLGELKKAAPLAGATMDGLGQASLAVNQAFATQVGNTNALFDSWRRAGIQSNMFTQGVKDSIAPLTKYAKGSHEATAQLVGLAQEAGYDGPNSLRSLTKWLGNTHDATQNVKNITNQATIQEALLTSSMQAQGSFIANKLIGDINNAEMAYFHVTQDATAWGNAIAKSGRQSDEAKAARTKLINDLISSGEAAHQTTGQIGAMITKVTGIPKQKAIQLVLSAKASGSITMKEQEFGRKPGGFLSFHSRGARIGPGYGGGDQHLAMLEAGETVVPKHLTPKVAPLMHAQHVPGFQRGGLMGSGTGNPQYIGPTDDFTGQWAVNDVNDFASGLQHEFGKLVKHGIRDLVAHAQSMMFGSGMAIADFARTFATGQNHPYVWGGMSPSGWDCSGFTSFIYDHFGYGPPRTSEAQFGWARKASDQPGALAFFVSAAGGPPPGHVGISMGNGKMVSALGTAYGTIMSSTAGNMGFGIPPGGFIGAGAGGTGGTQRETQLAELWISAGGPRSIAHLMSAIAMAESHGIDNAHNPSGASGLWQILGPIIPSDGPFLFDPKVNAREAVLKWRLQGLSAWSTYTNGAYRQYMGAGGLINEPIAGLGLSTGRSYMMGEAGPEYITPGDKMPAGQHLSELADLLRENNDLVGELIDAVQTLPGDTGEAFGRALNQTSRHAGRSGTHSTR